MTSHGTLQAYEKESGQWLWQQADSQGALSSLWSPQGPVFFQNLVLAGFPSGHLQAFEASTGKPVWKESFESSVVEGFESFNDVKSVQAGAEFLVASSFSGDLKVWRSKPPAKKLLWQKRISLYSPVTLDGSGLIFLSARDGSIQALELETGYEKWKFQLPRGIGTQPALQGERIWIATSTGEIFIFSKSGQLLARSEDYESSFWNSLSLLSESEGLLVSSRGLLRRLKINPSY
jgi:outer membrane protein assembly factor BamB